MARPGFILSFLALLGLLVSGLLALRTYGREAQIESAVLAQAIESHARLVQDRLSERELLTRVAVGLIRSSSPLEPNALKSLRPSIYAFKSDFVLASWIARFRPEARIEAQDVLRQSGSGLPIRNFDDAALPAGLAAAPLDVLMDVEPRTAQTAELLGRTLNDSPIVGPVLRAAQESRTPAASAPFALPRTDDAVGILLVAPAFDESSASPLGFVGFSFRLGPLMLASDRSAPFRILLSDPRATGKELAVDDIGRIQSVAQTEGGWRMQKTVSFGGRDWGLAYYAKIDPASRARTAAALVFAYGLVITAAICALFGYFAAGNLRLSSEIRSRVDFEKRLSMVIGELNHRVKNVLAVTQSIVTRTVRPGADVEESRELLIGRIHAMSHVVSLLSDRSWQGVRLQSLLDTRAMPNHARIHTAGPDIVISARAAQNLALSFFELASHAAPEEVTHRPLHIVVTWTVSGDEGHEVFGLRWEEFNATPATRRRDNDFGVSLLDRVMPEAIGGTSRRHFTDVSYVYELTAPMHAVTDRAEMDRTLRWAQRP